MRTVAGILLPDTSIANSATELVRDVSPRYLFHHVMRTFIFASLIGRARGSVYDAETLYLSCVLHDLGLTQRFEGDLPFEIQGAESARRLLEQYGVTPARIETIWDGIALHASAVGAFKRPEIALVGAGAEADVLGPQPGEISAEAVSAAGDAFPRLSFKSEFLRTCADIVRRHPAGAARSFMRDVGERYVDGFRPASFCDRVINSPFDE